MNYIATISMSTAIWVLACVWLFVGFEGSLSSVAVILLLLFTYSSVMLWRAVFSNQVAPLDLIFWLFHTNFLLLPAFSQTYYRAFFWGSYDVYRQDVLLYACTVIAIGLLAVQIGSQLGQPAGNRHDNTRVRNRLLTDRLGDSWLSSIFLVAVLAALVGLVMVLGSEFFTSNRMSKVGQVESLAQLGMLLTLPRALAFGALLYSIAILIRNLREGRSFGFVNTLILCAAVGVNAVVNFPLSLSRFWFFGFLISLVWIIFPLRTAMRRSMFVCSMTLLQFTFFPWYSQVTRNIGLIGFDLKSIREYVRYGDFDGFQTIANVILYVGEEGFTMGKNIASAFLFFVPRSVWEQKAAPLGVASAEFMGYPFTNLSAPIYSEFYADYGLLSLIFGMGCIGFFIRRFDSYYDSDLRENQIGIGFLLASIMAGYLIILLRGSLLGVLPGISTLIVVLLFTGMLGRAGARRI